MRAPPLAIWLWYRGGTFKGFQRQARGRTVQGALLEALAAAGVGATPSPAGRTDRGVHARMQVVSLRGAGDRSPDEVRTAIERAAPGELGVVIARPAAPAFHAQWQARGKEYRYRLSLGGGPVPAPWRASAWSAHEHPRLAGRPPAGPERVAELLRMAEGTRDFWALHGKSSPRKPRALREARLRELGGGLFEARLRGDSFARYQVRILVGTAVAVACGVVPEERWAAALERAEEIQGIKAPAEGLVLWSVEYPQEVDPFTPEERERAPGLPAGPPFD
jgi:tRNA pseudouridine38-40 synthase